MTKMRLVICMCRGYGPTTTEHEIRALFEPYVHVDEVVMKSNFSFVNTRDPTGAAQATRDIVW